MGRSLVVNVAYVAAFVVVVWLVGELAGFEIALWSTLLLSVGATLVLNLAIAGFRSRGR